MTTNDSKAERQEATMEEDEDHVTPWYKQEKYSRYWKHYNHCFNWYEKHIKTCSDIQHMKYNQDYSQFCNEWNSFMTKYQTFYHWWQYNQWNQSNREIFCQMHPPYEDRRRESYNHNVEQPYSPHISGDVFKAPHPVHPAKKDKNVQMVFSSSKTLDPNIMQGSPKRIATCSISDVSMSSESNSSVCSVSKRHRNRRRKKKRYKFSPRTSRYPSEDRSSNSLEMEMEITEEMLQFFALSAKHKHERDIKRKEVEETEEDYINLSEASTKHRARCSAPTEQPGLRRAEEMKVLYGRGAAMIHGMETAMQLNFDRLCDKMQSKPWPNIPLNVKFD